MTEHDQRWMDLALDAARAVRGGTWPNPPVGAVLVKDGALLARGATAEAGGPHAEAVCLAAAGTNARGAELFVTLEPCAHHGKTPPCADALAAAGVRRVVAALADPNPLVDGKGFAALRAAGIEVQVGTRASAAAHVVREFLFRQHHGRPWVTLKWAASLDGRIAAADGGARWISGEKSREHAHGLRREAHAVLVGAGTVRQDDPRLDCRLPGTEQRFQPIPVVLCASGDMPADARLMQGDRRVLVLVGRGRGQGLPRRPQVEIHELPGDGNDPRAVLEVLAGLGIVSVLVEGGRAVFSQFVRAGLFERCVVYQAPLLLGGEGLPVFEALGIGRMADGRRLRGAWTMLGDDACFDGAPAGVPDGVPGDGPDGAAA